MEFLLVGFNPNSLSRCHLVSTVRPTHCLIFRFVYARIDRPAGTIKFGALGRTAPIQMVKWSNHPWLQKAKRQTVLYIYINYIYIRVYMIIYVYRFVRSLKQLYSKIIFMSLLQLSAIRNWFTFMQKALMFV